MQTEKSHIKNWIAPPAVASEGHATWAINNRTDHPNLYTLHFSTDPLNWFLIKTLKAGPHTTSGAIFIPVNCQVAIMYHGEPDDFDPCRDLLRLDNI